MIISLLREQFPTCWQVNMCRKRFYFYFCARLKKPILLFSFLHILWELPSGRFSLHFPSSLHPPFPPSPLPQEGEGGGRRRRGRWGDYPIYVYMFPAPSSNGINVKGLNNIALHTVNVWIFNLYVANTLILFITKWGLMKFKVFQLFTLVWSMQTWIFNCINVLPRGKVTDDDKILMQVLINTKTP